MSDGNETEEYAEAPAIGGNVSSVSVGPPEPRAARRAIASPASAEARLISAKARAARAAAALAEKQGKQQALDDLAGSMVQADVSQLVDPMWLLERMAQLMRTAVRAGDLGTARSVLADLMKQGQALRGSDDEERVIEQAMALRGPEVVERVAGRLGLKVTKIGEDPRAAEMASRLLSGAPPPTVSMDALPDVSEVSGIPDEMMGQPQIVTPTVDIVQRQRLAGPGRIPLPGLGPRR